MYLCEFKVSIDEMTAQPIGAKHPAVIVMRLLCHGDDILRCRCCHMEGSASESHTFVSMGNVVGVSSLGCCRGKMVIMVCSRVMIQHNSTGALKRSFRKWQSRPLAGAIPSAAPAARGNHYYYSSYCLCLRPRLQPLSSI